MIVNKKHFLICALCQIQKYEILWLHKAVGEPQIKFVIEKANVWEWR